MIRRTRKLAGPSFPEYVAIDNVQDAICVVSQSDFKFYFDSTGLVNIPGASKKKGNIGLYLTYLFSLICVYA